MSGVARSFLIGVLAIAVFSLLPFTSYAVPYLCPETNAACEAKGAKIGTPCVCVVASFTLTGACFSEDGKRGCKVISYPGLDGKPVPIDQAAFEVTDKLVTSVDKVGQSFLGEIGSFMSKNPLLTGLAIGAGTQLLSSLMSPSGGSSGSSGSGTYNSTYCITGQYYYSANPPVGDPCAVYSPSGGAGTTLPSEGAGGTSIADLLKDAGDETALTA